MTGGDSHEAGTDRGAPSAALRRERLLCAIRRNLTPRRAAEVEAQIAACPTPYYHDTHRYCPSCPWTEE